MAGLVTWNTPFHICRREFSTWRIVIRCASASTRKANGAYSLCPWLFILGGMFLSAALCVALVGTTLAVVGAFTAVVFHDLPPALESPDDTGIVQSSNMHSYGILVGVPQWDMEQKSTKWQKWFLWCLSSALFVIYAPCVLTCTHSSPWMSLLPLTTKLLSPDSNKFV